MISIQNSFKKVKINLILTETIQLPLSFVSGIFFISGSITGSLLTVNYKNKEIHSAINLSALIILEIPLENKREQQF